MLSNIFSEITHLIHIDNIYNLSNLIFIMGFI